MEVIWSETALFQLKNIFDYYTFVASKEVAKKITQNLVDRTILLTTFPEIGAIQNLIPIRKIEYRYIVEGNYKIIYHIIENSIRISTVFDTRQEPRKLGKFLEPDL